MAKNTWLLNDGKTVVAGVINQFWSEHHDEEWGRALHDEHKHFEFLLLETMMA